MNRPWPDASYLPAGWGDLERFEERVDLGGTAVWLAGVCARRHADGWTITGSSASAGEGPPRDIAWFELLERIVVSDVTAYGVESAPMLDAQGATTGERTRVLSGTRSGDGWRTSISNGAAFFCDARGASQRALAELCERDAILRHWESGRSGVPAEASQHPLCGLPGRIDCRLFGRTLAGHVAGVFYDPQDATLPATSGFGTGTTPSDAIASACDECLQAAAFLWGEEIEAEEPESAPTPLYHQAYYLSARGRRELWRWLAAPGLVESAQGAGKPRFVDLTPAWMPSPWRVVRAEMNGARELRFGRVGTARPHPVA